MESPAAKRTVTAVIAYHLSKITTKLAAAKLFQLTVLHKPSAAARFAGKVAFSRLIVMQQHDLRGKLLFLV
jgi:hypothetical protein